MATEIERSLPPAMEGIVADVQLSNTNYLTHNRVYSKVGQTELLVADPAMVHFGGFQVGEVYKQTLRITNTFTAGTRVHIIPPTTPFFKARCDDKKGLLAPGMAEVIEVEFCPTAYKYYYDTVRIHSEGTNLLIPLHGYPVMNETKFPKRVDFGVGKVALGDTVTKRFKMECKVPIDFEYEISIVKPCASFKVEPLRGVVPAHGHVTVSITFEPLALSTQVMELEVRVAEFNSQPTRCVITGAATPGLAKDRLLAAGDFAKTLANTGRRPAGGTESDSAASVSGAWSATRGGPHSKTQSAGGAVIPPLDESARNAMQVLALTMEQLDGAELIKTAPKLANKGGGTIRGGAGGGDAYTVLLNEERKARRGDRDCRKTGPITLRPPQLPPTPAEVLVNGVCFPHTDLTTTADVTYVLNQQPGKLRIKDVKDAIRSKQREQDAHRAELDAIMAQGMNGGVHPLERPEVPAHIKAALFAQLLSQSEEGQRRVALGSNVHIGHDIMGAEDVAEAQRLREQQHTAHQLSTELTAARRLEPLCEPAGALHLPAAARGDAGGDGSALSGAAFAATARSTDSNYKPAWRLIEADDLEKRAAIQGVLAQLGWDKQRLAEESANPVLLVSEADRPGTAPTKYLKPENVRTRPLPLYRDINFTYHGPVSMSHYTDFDELGPQKPKEPLEYQILGYEMEEFPGLTPYTPPLLDQPLEAGAAEERSAEGLQPYVLFTAAECAALPSLPDGMKQAPFTTLEIGNRYTEDKVFARLEPSWGMDTQFQIQPALFAHHDSAQCEVLPSGAVRALRDVTSLSDRWIPRHDRWAAQLTPEVIPGLMSAPDPSDLLKDSPDDADKPAIQFTVPTDDEISALLPEGLPNMLLHRPHTHNTRHATHTQGSQPQDTTSTGSQQSHTQLSATQNEGVSGSLHHTSAQDATQGGGSSGSEGDKGRRAAVLQSAAEACQFFQMLRQKRQDELDSEKRSSRAQWLAALQEQLLETYNSKLKLPSVYAVRL